MQRRHSTRHFLGTDSQSEDPSGPSCGEQSRAVEWESWYDGVVVMILMANLFSIFYHIRIRKILKR